MNNKQKTSKGTWALVVLVIVVSIAGAAYKSHMKAEVQREVREKYPTMQVTPNDIDGCVDGAECYTVKE